MRKSNSLGYILKNQNSVLLVNSSRRGVVNESRSDCNLLQCTLFSFTWQLCTLTLIKIHFQWISRSNPKCNAMDSILFLSRKSAEIFEFKIAILLLKNATAILLSDRNKILNDEQRRQRNNLKSKSIMQKTLYFLKKWNV